MRMAVTKEKFIQIYNESGLDSAIEYAYYSENAPQMGVELLQVGDEIIPPMPKDEYDSLIHLYLNKCLERDDIIREALKDIAGFYTKVPISYQSKVLDAVRNINDDGWRGELMILEEISNCFC